MTKNEILHIVHILAFLAKINSVIDPAEKGIFKIVCERFKIENSDNIFNINQDYINRLHNISVNPIFKIHIRSIFPIPLNVYFRKSNPNG